MPGHSPEWMSPPNKRRIRIKITITLSRDELEKLDGLAKMKKTSRSRFVAILVEDACDTV